MNEVINIACSINNSYAKYCIVMLTSIFENNRKNKFHIYILANELSSELKDLINDLVENKYNQKISFCYIDQNKLNNSQIYHYSKVPVSMYYRLFLEDFIDESIKKIIYLDSDIICCGNIKELWDFDISEFAIGCVEDMWSEKKEIYSRLNYDKSYSYFNSGVLLVNLDYWRNIKFENKAIDYIKSNYNILKFNDQDVLNALLHEKKLILPLRWNLQDGFYRKKKKINKESIIKLKTEIKHPMIIHFTGYKKPWTFKCEHPLRDEYYKYLDLTIWKGERPIKPLKYKLLSMFSIFRNRYIKI